MKIINDLMIIYNDYKEFKTNNIFIDCDYYVYLIKENLILKKSTNYITIFDMSNIFIKGKKNIKRTINIKVFLKFFKGDDLNILKFFKDIKFNERTFNNFDIYLNSKYLKNLSELKPLKELNKTITRTTLARLYFNNQLKFSSDIYNQEFEYKLFKNCETNIYTKIIYEDNKIYIKVRNHNNRYIRIIELLTGNNFKKTRLKFSLNSI